MRIAMMVMAMIMFVAMFVAVVMMVAVIMMMIGIQTTGTRAEMVTQVTILDIAARCRDTLPLDMVMVAFLWQTNLCLKAKHLRTIFTHGAIHIVAAFNDLPHPVGKGRNHFWMVVQITCLDEFYIGMCGRHLVSKTVNAVNQNAREQKNRETARYA